MRNSGDPQSLNLYSYAGNNPVNQIDGDGHMVVGFTGAGVFHVGGSGVNDGSGGLTDPFAVSWIRAWISYTVQYADGCTGGGVRAGDVEISGTGEWLNKTNRTYAPAGSPAHFASVGYYRMGAGYVGGHVGIGIDTDYTQGMATQYHHNFLFYLIPFVFAEGEVKYDIQTYTKNNVAPVAYYVHIPISEEAAKSMQQAIDDRVANPGRYNLYFRNCADFVEDVLRAGGVNGVPHNVVFYPPVAYQLMKGAY